MKTTTAENIRKELKALADPKYRKFHSYLLPGTDNILGVRIPQLRTMAKEIIKKDDWRPFVNPEKPDVPLNKNDAFQKVQKRHVQEKR